MVSEGVGRNLNSLHSGSTIFYISVWVNSQNVAADTISHPRLKFQSRVVGGCWDVCSKEGLKWQEKGGGVVFFLQIYIEKQFMIKYRFLRKERDLLSRLEQPGTLCNRQDMRRYVCTPTECGKVPRDRHARCSSLEGWRGKNCVFQRYRPHKREIFGMIIILFFKSR